MTRRRGRRGRSGKQCKTDPATSNKLYTESNSFAHDSGYELEVVMQSVMTSPAVSGGIVAVELVVGRSGSDSELFVIDTQSISGSTGDPVTFCITSESVRAAMGSADLASTWIQFRALSNRNSKGHIRPVKRRRSSAAGAVVENCTSHVISTPLMQASELEDGLYSVQTSGPSVDPLATFEFNVKSSKRPPLRTQLTSESQMTQASDYRHVGSVHHVLYSMRCKGFTWRVWPRDDRRCPWCGVYCGAELRGLMLHLSLSHDRLLCTYSVDPETGSDEVSVSVCEDYANCADPAVGDYGYELLSNDSFLWLRSGSGQSVTMEVEKRGGDGAFEDRGQHFRISERHKYPNPKGRQYYHMRTLQPMVEGTSDVDSEDEPDTTWLTKRSEEALAEFEDVNASEKLLMNLWNRHMRKYPIIADDHVYASTEVFLAENSASLFRLRNNFALHLANMHALGILNSSQVLMLIQRTDNLILREREARKTGGRFEQ